MRFARNCLAIAMLFAFAVTTSAEEPPPRFVIRSVTVPEGQTGAVRLDCKTGKCYQPSGNFWKLIVDPVEIPEGRYDVLLTVVGSGWTALRWNVDTGETWRLDGNTWRKAEFVDKPPMVPPAETLGVE